MFSFSCDPTSLYHNQGVPGSGRLGVARAGQDGQRATAVSRLPRQAPSVPVADPDPDPLPVPVPVPEF